MIVGEHSRENDLTVNITRKKEQSNVRSSNKDSTVVLNASRILSLEESIEFMDDDEYLEVTPESLRLRKQILDKNMRAKESKKKKTADLVE
jgi:GTP-binding protein